MACCLMLYSLPSYGCAELVEVLHVSLGWCAFGCVHELHLCASAVCTLHGCNVHAMYHHSTSNASLNHLQYTLQQDFNPHVVVVDFTTTCGFVLADLLNTPPTHPTNHTNNTDSNAIVVLSATGFVEPLISHYTNGPNSVLTVPQFAMAVRHPMTLWQQVNNALAYVAILYVADRQIRKPTDALRCACVCCAVLWENTGCAVLCCRTLLSHTCTHMCPHVRTCSHPCRHKYGVPGDTRGSFRRVTKWLINV